MNKDIFLFHELLKVACLVAAEKNITLISSIQEGMLKYGIKLDLDESGGVKNILLYPIERSNDKNKKEFVPKWELAQSESPKKSKNIDEAIKTTLQKHQAFNTKLDTYFGKFKTLYSSFIKSLEIEADKLKNDNVDVAKKLLDIPFSSIEWITRIDEESQKQIGDILANPTEEELSLIHDKIINLKNLLKEGGENYKIENIQLFKEAVKALGDTKVLESIDTANAFHDSYFAFLDGRKKTLEEIRKAFAKQITPTQLEAVPAAPQQEELDLGVKQNETN